MRLGLLFYGMSKCHYNYYISNIKYYIDYEKSYENYKKFIFDFFIRKGYDIDVYFTTNYLDEADTKTICEKYNPKKYNFMENVGNQVISRNSKLINVVNLCLESKKSYDLILITRFDLLFQKNFSESNIQFDKFNLVSMLEKPNFICDNFYLFPYKYLETFLNIAKNNLNNRFHDIKNELYQKINPKYINYILNENCYVEKLSFYKIVRTVVVPKKEMWVTPKKSDTKFGFLDSINNTPYKIKSVNHKPQKEGV
jgi:hypothetical protein